MLAKVLIKRQFKPNKMKEILTLLNEFRTGAMGQPGYISGETLMDHNNPYMLMVIGTWQNIDSWFAWKENPKRLNFEEMLAIYQEGPTQYEEYVLGTISNS